MQITRLSIKSFLFSILSLPCLCSCEIETHGNGDIDGFWQLNAIDSLYNNTRTDATSSRIFWAVQAKLLKTTDYTGNNPTLLMRFILTGDSLRLHSPVIHKRSIHNADKVDTPLEEPSPLFPYGIQSLDETFKVLLLNGDRMILESDVLRLHFVKF